MKDWLPAAAGFTLLEIVVTMGVIVLLTSIGAASYNGFNDTQRLKQAGLTLKSNLRVAQTKAVSGNKPAGGCTTFVGFVVSFDATGYTVNPECSEGVIDDPTAVTLAAGLTLSPVPPSFTFLTLTGRLSLTSDQTIVIQSVTKKYTLTVHPNGDIDDSGIASL